MNGQLCFFSFFIYFYDSSSTRIFDDMTTNMFFKILRGYTLIKIVRAAVETNISLFVIFLTSATSKLSWKIPRYSENTTKYQIQLKTVFADEDRKYSPTSRVTSKRIYSQKPRYRFFDRFSSGFLE